MNTFVDSSAFYAVLDADDQNHDRARFAWLDLLRGDVNLICTNYVLVETFALVQHRLGLEAVRTFQTESLPVIQVEWIDESQHQAGIAAPLTASRRQLSLVDCVSFEVMRRLGLTVAFPLDSHFTEQGFKGIP